jgi:tripartite-type tricarboxylate transporter receptor subunit TctC
MSLRSKALTIGLGLGLFAVTAAPLQAAFPERTVTFYIMQKTGGGTDTMFRAFMPFFEKHLGGSVAIVNKSGAGGATMLNFMARAEADGYTIGTTNLPNMVVSTIIRKGLHYTVDSFDQLGTLNVDPSVIYVRSDSKYKTFAEIVADAKKNPGKLGLGGANMRNHGIAMVRLEDTLGVDFNLIDFGGGGPTRKAVLGGHVPLGVQGAGAVLRFHPKKVRILVQLSPKRRPHTMEIPTITEATGAKIYHNVIRMAGAPKGVPADVLAKLRKAWKDGMHDPEWIAKAKKLEIPVLYMSPEEAAQEVKDMNEQMKALFAKNPDLMKLTKKKKK